VRCTAPRTSCRARMIREFINDNAIAGPRPRGDLEKSSRAVDEPVDKSRTVRRVTLLLILLVRKSACQEDAILYAANILSANAAASQLHPDGDISYRRADLANREGSCYSSRRRNRRTGMEIPSMLSALSLPPSPPSPPERIQRSADSISLYRKSNSSCGSCVDQDEFCTKRTIDGINPRRSRRRSREGEGEGEDGGR